MLNDLRRTCGRAEMGVFFAAPLTSFCHATTLRSGVRGGLDLGTPRRAMGVYFADTGYQKNITTWTPKAASTHAYITQMWTGTLPSCSDVQP